jgi:Skp family chaperone for outer membrane proteins
MSTKIEHFIKANKTAFDTENPGEDLWLKLSQDLDKKSRKGTSMRLWLSIAASLIAVMSIAYLYSQKSNVNGATLAQVSPSQAKKQVRFTSLIEKKADSLEVYGRENPELYKKFSSDLERIQADYDGLKQELLKSPNQEFIIRAMEKNLELQLRVVSQQLEIINQVSEVKKDNQL